MLIFGLLTALTQLGGIAYLIGLVIRRSWLVGFAAYVSLSVMSVFVAPQFGRVALPCFGEDRVVASRLLCAMNRTYVDPVAADVVKELQATVPGTQVLDANFPFFDGFPLLPHLSHDDGRKVDLALYYKGSMPSPIGYFAYENGPTRCRKEWLTLRWDMAWLQPVFPKSDLDHAATRQAVQFLAGHEQVEKLFLEPHLQDRLGLSFAKVRFQGCRAARHDDHIHFQIR